MQTSNLPDALWLTVSPSLKHFDQPLLRHLSRHITIAEWAYNQTLDEESSLSVAVSMLHDYLKSRPQPIHLLGHGTGGLVGLLYARQYPGRVRSLTLLAVGAQPAVDWKAHYYVRRQLFPCTRQIVLAQMVDALFGRQLEHRTKRLVQLLAQDLDYALSPHSLFKQTTILPGGAPIPLMVCGSRE
ncbi:MAG: alpha/beta fold hydrolase, partial [Cyanothece sp. SIO1E1]|nr:alpha/beta fold hydrolase [Cyanothece sp. SIO1E1]